MDDVAALGVFAGGFCVVMLALVVVLAVVNVRAERRRSEGIAAWAVAHGWRYLRRPDVEWGAWLPGRNRAGVSFAVSTSVDGRIVSLAEYSYTEHSSAGTEGGSTSTTHRYVLVVVRLRRAYPRLAVERRGAFSRLGRALFGGGVQTGDEAFDRAFRVVAEQPAAAPVQITPALMAEHLAGTVPTWQIRGCELLATWSGRLTGPDQIPSFCRPMLRVAAVVDR